jgi:hypothetical protein
MAKEYRSDTQHREEIFLFLPLPQPPIQCVSWALFLRAKQLGHEADDLLPPSAKFKDV